MCAFSLQSTGVIIDQVGFFTDPRPTQVYLEGDHLPTDWLGYRH